MKAGGKWYVADWASEFEDVVWPEYVVFTSDQDTSKPNCMGDECNYADGEPEYDSEHSSATDSKLAAWLDGQLASDRFGGIGPIDASHWNAADNYNRIDKLGSVINGTNDDNTFPAVDGLVPGAGAIIAALETTLSNSISTLVREPATLFGVLAVLLWKFPNWTLGAMFVFLVAAIPIAIYSRKVRKSSRAHPRENSFFQKI